MRFRLLLTSIFLLLMSSVVSAQQSDTSTAPPGFKDWDDVLQQAKGTTVNWYLWGGSDAINTFVEDLYGKMLHDEFGITLNRVGVADTVDAVNTVLSEHEAGITKDGAVDMIWINGENFFTLRQADLLYGPWAQTLPNSALVNWENPAVAYDFGVPVKGYESPWSSAQLHFIYDPARIAANELPHNFDELTTWMTAHPGHFTYIAPGPGGFMGTRFVKEVLYSISGGYEQWVGPWDKDQYAQWSSKLWEYLNAWKPNLWRNGETYPANENELAQLFANGEVAFAMTQAVAGAGPLIASGVIPDTSRAFTLDQYSIGDYNYVAIPTNASHKAAALVVANLLLRPDRQAGQIRPETGFGLGYAIDISRVSGDDQKLLQQAFVDLGIGAADPAALAKAFAPDMAPEAQAIIEADWEANVLRK